MMIDGTPPPDGVRCLPQHGQFLSPTDDTTAAIPGRDGQLWLRGRQKAREFDVAVVARAASRAALAALLDATAAWLAGRGPVRLVFDEELPDRGWTARLATGLSWELAKASLRVRCDIGFVADDPHAYALVDDVATLTAPGTVARAKGNAPSEPVIEVAGALTASQTVTLDLWGKPLQISGPLAAGQKIRLDFREGLHSVVDASGDPVRLLTGQLSSSARRTVFARDRAICPAGGGPVSWTTTGAVSQVRVECNSRWL